MITHLPEKYREKFYCDQCSYVTVLSKQMTLHVKRDHGTDAKKKVEFECFCGKMFSSKVGLNNHVKYTHQRVRNHVCTICDKAFPTPSRLRVCTIVIKLNEKFIINSYIN